jgi:hypothetical protein
VCFVVHKTTSELEHAILTTMYLVGAKNIGSWCARMGDLQCAFLLYVPMVPSSALAITTDGDCLTCGGFSLGETVHLGSIEFVADYFGSLSLSPRRGDLGPTFMGSTHSRTSSP